MRWCAHLMGQIIRLDHLMAVARHFYTGRPVEDLVADFLSLSLSADRGQRFQSASDMLKELRALDLDMSDRRTPAGRREKTAGRGEKDEKGSLGIRIAPVTEVVVHAHKDYSLSRREKIIRFESNEGDSSGKAGKKKKKKAEER